LHRGGREPRRGDEPSRRSSRSAKVGVFRPHATRAPRTRPRRSRKFGVGPFCAARASGERAGRSARSSTCRPPRAAPHRASVRTVLFCGRHRSQHA
jgi:hypothetical protein